MSSRIMIFLCALRALASGPPATGVIQRRMRPSIHRLSAGRSLVTVLSVIGSLLAGARQSWATDVTLLLVDQNAVPIPASRFFVEGSVVDQGRTISLSEGSHTI